MQRNCWPDDVLGYAHFAEIACAGENCILAIITNLKGSTSFHSVRDPSPFLISVVHAMKYCRNSTYCISLKLNFRPGLCTLVTPPPKKSKVSAEGSYKTIVVGPSLISVCPFADFGIWLQSCNYICCSRKIYTFANFRSNNSTYLSARKIWPITANSSTRAFKIYIFDKETLVRRTRM